MSMPHPLLMDPVFVGASVLLLAGAFGWVADKVRARLRGEGGS